MTAVELDQWLADRGQKLRKSVEALKQEQPKELFEYLMREKLKRTISPRDFEEIGKRAGVTGLLACDSFRSIVHVLRLWFPPDTATLQE